MLKLENERFCVSIDEQGAELTSWVSKKDGAEYVWQADPAVWKRHAPLLFPIVGRLKEQTYTAAGVRYEITQHGFGRDLPWQVVRAEAGCAELLLRQNDYTKKMYPWDFCCTVRYTLEGDTLRKEHIMRNEGDTDLYYEVGGHDGYNLLHAPDETASDCYVEFEGTTLLHPIQTDENVMLSRAHGALPLENNRLYLTPHVFRNDAIILDDLPVRRVTIGSGRGTRSITMDFADFPYFAVWSKYLPEGEVPFVCLEPWSALPDGGYLDLAIENKVGVRVLAPGQEETLSFSTTVRE